MATKSPSRLIDARIEELGGWRGEMLGRLRALIKAADPGVVEEWKWDVPVWSHDGLICTGEAYKSAVKTTFAKGASLSDPSHLFNSSLTGNTRRATCAEGAPALSRGRISLDRSSSRCARACTAAVKSIRASSESRSRRRIPRPRSRGDIPAGAQPSIRRAGRSAAPSLRDRPGA